MKEHKPGFLAMVADAKKRVKEIDIVDYRALVDATTPHLLVDVREDNEWAAGHALGSIHLSKGILERDIESVVPDPHTSMVLYCGGGYRSALAADALQKMGYSKVMSLDGGWRAFEASGLPIVTS
jgi:rhodanese-related sulfurtransferase